MGVLTVACLLCLALLPGALSVVLSVQFDSNGVSGGLRFTQQATGQATTVSGIISGAGAKTHWEVRTLPVRLDMANRCANLGQRYTTLGGAIPNVNSAGTISGADLPDVNTIYGRSIVFTNPNDANDVACGTLEADNVAMVTMVARFKDTIAGDVVFRQSTTTTDPASILVDLFSVTNTATAAQEQLNWSIYSKLIQDDDSVASRCQNLGVVYNPSSVDGTGCTTASHQNCKAGDFSGKHNDVTVSVEKGGDLQMLLDKGLSLGGSSSISGRTLVVMTSVGIPVSCCKIVQYSTRIATATFSRNEVEGTITLSQRSPFDATTVNVNLTGLAGLAGSFHIHINPVPLQMTPNQNVCGADYLAGFFDPYDRSGPFPGQAAGTMDQYIVGDLSMKYGSLGGLQAQTVEHTDRNLPLFGANSVIGRSVVIHKGANRWVCASLESDAAVLQALATFTYPVIGYIFLRQAQTDDALDTQIYMSLDYGNSATPVATVGHTWHVHVDRINEVFGMDVADRCSSVMGHYNPHSVDLDGNYGTACTSSNQLRCEVGDMSGKHGKLNVRNAVGGKSIAFFTDIDLPLSGPNSVMSRSMVIHAADSGGARLSCANLFHIPPRRTKIMDWTNSYTGITAFNSNAEGILAGTTSVSLNLGGLDSMADGYHVHSFPVPEDSPSCSSTAVGGHYNPLSVNGSPTNGSDDKYETGDLSGKYGRPLNGQTSLTWNGVDTNLPLRGSDSVVGRSVVMHYNDGSRWMCGNIVEDTASSDAKLFRAKATFTGDVEGDIIMTQYQYPDGGLSDATVQIDLRNKADPTTVTWQHNYHIHEKPMFPDTDCNSAGPHYNPFMVNLDNYTECMPTNALRCEMGDLSSKLAKFDIGNGKKLYTDVHFNIVDKYGVVGKSIVVHAANGGGARIACADVMPMDGVNLRMTFPYDSANVDKSALMTVISTAINTGNYNMAVKQISKGPGCIDVDVMFTGANATTMKSDLNQLLMHENSALGAFVPAVCASEKRFPNNINTSTGKSTQKSAAVLSSISSELRRKRIMKYARRLLQEKTEQERATILISKLSKKYGPNLPRIILNKLMLRFLRNKKSLCLGSRKYRMCCQREPRVRNVANAPVICLRLVPRY